MQNAKKNQKKKRELVYKPYLKGTPWGGDCVGRALKILMYYVMFLVLFLVTSAFLNSSSHVFVWVSNLALVIVAGMMIYADGARVGESHTALGEIAYSRREAGKEVPVDELQKCFHPLKGFFIMLLAMLPLLVIAVVYALSAQKQTYQLQVLPEWVSSFEKDGEVMLPLSYYLTRPGLQLSDYLGVLVRLLTFPFVHIFRLYGADAVLLGDRLSPLLICVPALGYPLGYLTGPRSRAMVHGDIKSSVRRAQRRRASTVRANRKRTEKKNELI